MNNRPQYATRAYTIPAGATVELIRSATFVTVLSATGPFKARFDDAPSFDLEQGLTIRTPNGFRRMEFTNPGASAISVKVGVGRGDVNDARLTLSGQVNTAETMPDTLTTGAPVAATNAAVTQIAATNPLRREVLAVVDTGAAGPVYIGGDAGAAAGQGIPVQPGQSLTLSTTAALYARNDTGGAVNVYVAEMERGA